HWLGPAPAPNVRRQDLTPSVAPSGAVYVTRLSALRSRAAFVVPDVTVGVERDSVRSLDVDTPADLLAARRAGQLVAPPSPTRVLTRTVSPVEDDVVVIDGTPCPLKVVAADALAPM